MYCGALLGLFCRRSAKKIKAGQITPSNAQAAKCLKLVFRSDKANSQNPKTPNPYKAAEPYSA